MKPVDFERSTHILAKGQEQYQALPVFQDGTETISCWELTDEDIEILKKTCKIWMRQLNFGKALQPQLPMVVSPFGDRPKSIDDVPAADEKQPCIECGGSGVGPDSVVGPGIDNQGPCEHCDGKGLEPKIGPMKTFQVTWNYDDKIIIGLLTVKDALFEDLEQIVDSVIVPGYQIDQETGKLLKIHTFAMIPGKSYDKTTHLQKMAERKGCEHSIQDMFIKDGIFHCDECERNNGL